MKRSLTRTIRLTLYNDLTRTTSQAKQLKVTLTYASEDSQKLSDMAEDSAKILDALDGSHLIGVNNTDLIRLLEPKTGASVHPFLHTLKEKVGPRSFIKLGGMDVVPPDTVNGDRVVVLGQSFKVTLEGLAEFLLLTTRAEGVWVDDGTYAVVVDDDDVTTLL